jgi:hypothetical protein
MQMEVGVVGFSSHRVMPHYCDPKTKLALVVFTLIAFICVHLPFHLWQKCIAFDFQNPESVSSDSTIFLASSIALTRRF